MSENEHKIGDLLVRVDWHKKWNYKQSDICYGTIIGTEYDNYHESTQYKVHWWDNYIITSRNIMYNTKQIREFKRILLEWMLKTNENR